MSNKNAPASGAPAPPQQGSETSMRKQILGAVATVGYAASIVAANLATDRYAMTPVGFGLAATAGTYAAGSALLLRDAVQVTLGKWAVAAAVLVGAVISAITAPGLAMASAAAFLLSEFADFAVYTRLRRRGWLYAVAASNVAGAVLDTAVFLGIAGFPVTVHSVSGQVLGKTWATAIVVVPALVFLAGRQAVRRVVPRYAVES